MKRILPPLVVLLVVTVAVEVYLRIEHVPKIILPLPSQVLSRLVDDRAELLAALWTTTQAALIGLAASTVVGIVAAIGLAASPWLRRGFYPYTVFFQTVPIIAIAPMLVIWFDSALTRVAVSAFICSIFPVIANTLSGLQGTEPALLDLFALYGAGPWQRLWKLRLPWALPNIVTGLRVAAGLAVIGTVVGELLVGEIGTNEGLGVKIASAAKTGRTDKVFAAVLIASLLGLVFFAAINLFGHLTLRRWHASEQPLGR